MQTFHALSARLAWAAAVVASLALATEIEARAEAFKPTRTYALECRIDLKGNLTVRNTTGRTLPQGSRVKLAQCTKVGCRNSELVIYPSGGLLPGKTYTWLAKPGQGSCTVTVTFPMDEKVNTKRTPYPYSDPRPTPGLLKP